MCGIALAFFTNRGETDSSLLENVRIADGILPLEDAVLYHGNGDTLYPDGYERYTDDLSVPVVMTPKDGTSCNGAFASHKGASGMGTAQLDRVRYVGEKQNEGFGKVRFIPNAEADTVRCEKPNPVPGIADEGSDIGRLIIEDSILDEMVSRGVEYADKIKLEPSQIGRVILMLKPHISGLPPTVLRNVKYSSMSCPQLRMIRKNKKCVLEIRTHFLLNSNFLISG